MSGLNWSVRDIDAEPAPSRHVEPSPFEALTTCPSCDTLDYHLIVERVYVPTGNWRFGEWAVLDGPLPSAWTDNFSLKPVVELKTRREHGVLREMCAHLARECLPCGHLWRQSLGWTKMAPDPAAARPA